MNNYRLEIFTEERSMEFFLRALLPRILPSGFELDVNCFIRPHEGKSDLKRSLSKKVKAFPHFSQPVKLLIIHDQDSNECKVLKASLISECSNIKSGDFLVRIACKELENWYLGDFGSIETVYPDIRISGLTRKAKFRNPDRLNGSEEMNILIRHFSKSHASRELGRIINIENNNSPSFNCLITGIAKLLT
jgi:hypothetical protein